MQLRPAPEVAKIVAELIEDVDVHWPLDSCRIECLFMKDAPVKGGRLVLGRARRVGGLTAYLADRLFHAQELYRPPVPFFVIEIAEPQWREMTDDQRRALVDHELCHCVVDDDTADGVPKLSTRGHDLEEFFGIVARHGLWSADITMMAGQVSKQLALAIDDAEQWANEGVDQ